MRRELLLCLIVAWIGISLTVAPAEESSGAYPTRQVRIVVPYPAGSGIDRLGRIIARNLSERFGKSFYVENVVGLSGGMGAAQVAKATPDGHTLLITTNDFAVGPATNENLRYDPVANFSPVSILCEQPQVLAVHSSVAAKTINEFVAEVRKNPDRYSYAGYTSGFGLLSAERLFRLGLKLPTLVRVPFNGAAAAINSTLAGSTQVVFVGLANVGPYVESGQLKIIAVANPTRLKAFPDIQTLREAGIPDQDSPLLNGIVAPAGTPSNIINLLQREIATILDRPDIRAILSRDGVQVVAGRPSEYSQQIQDDIRIWRQVNESVAPFVQGRN